MIDTICLFVLVLIYARFPDTKKEVINLEYIIHAWATTFNLNAIAMFNAANEITE